MPKQKGKGGKGGKGGSKKKAIDWAADENFDKNRSIIYIEHTTECPIFQVKAEEVKTVLATEIPERHFELIRNQYGKVPPRAGAFEIGFSQHARTSVHNLWSGLDKGPPRRDKFPLNYDPIIKEVRKILKKFYPDPDALPEDDMGADEVPTTSTQ